MGSSHRKIYVRKTVDELLFTGYTDSLLTMGKMMSEADVPSYDRFGWFYMVSIYAHRMSYWTRSLVSFFHLLNDAGSSNPSRERRTSPQCDPLNTRLPVLTVLRWRVSRRMREKCPPVREEGEEGGERVKTPILSSAILAAEWHHRHGRPLQHGNGRGRYQPVGNPKEMESQRRDQVLQESV